MSLSRADTHKTEGESDELHLDAAMITDFHKMFNQEMV